MMDDEKNKRDFEEVRENCPWRFDVFGGSNKCRPIKFRFRITGVSATLRDCTQKNCPIFHFKKFFTGKKW